MNSNLANYTVENLKNIARVRKIKGFSKLKKQELIDKIKEDILDKNTSYEFFKLLNDNEFEVLKKSLDNNYILEENYFAELDLEEYGYVYITDENEVKIDEDIKNLFNQINTEDFRKDREKCQMIFNYCDSAINLYGIFSDEKIVEIINSQNNIKITKEDVSYVLNNSITDMEYSDGYIFEEQSFMISEEEYKKYIEDLLQKQADKPYYVPEKEEFLKYKNLLYFEKNKQYEEIYKFFYKKTKSKELATYLSCEVHYDLVQGSNLNQLFQKIDSYDIVFENEKELKECVALITVLNNNTRMKENRGHTPNEIKSMSSLKSSKTIENSKKVGRNDPCPCGSGKKYKKCCGRN